MESIGFKDKFIGFMDVLGWKSMVGAAEAGSGMSLSLLLEELKKFGSAEIRNQFEKNGRPNVCPMSTFIQPHLDFRLNQASDSVVISSEISPAGAINLLAHCWGSAMALLRSGIMCRGYITRGAIFHSETNFVGTGYQNAVEAEKNVRAFKRVADERGTPFVEVDRAVCDYISNCNDECVKTMFARFVEGDGDVMALFPFKRLCHNFIIAGFGHKFNGEAEKQANQNMRLEIQKLRQRVMAHVDETNPDAMRKAQHYILALESQLQVCDKTDEMIDGLSAPFPRGRY